MKATAINFLTFNMREHNDRPGIVVINVLVDGEVIDTDFAANNPVDIGLVITYQYAKHKIAEVQIDENIF